MKKRQKVIIDGYNVIHADESLRSRAASDLERARAALIEQLRDYLQDRAAYVTVVFDGQGRVTDAESIIPLRLQVLFSRFDQSADELILWTLRQSANPREYIVVTSDSADIGREARSLGAQVLASRDFLKRVSQPPHRIQNGPEQALDPAIDDMAFWLEIFSEEKRVSSDPTDPPPRDKRERS